MVVNGVKSSWCLVPRFYGAPQGSELGLGLFNILTNQVHPQQGMESPSLEAFTRQVDVALRDMV